MKPNWIRVKLPSGEKYHSLKTLSEGLQLNTVCQEARCPNIEECWNGGTATFMLMGDTCTRGCRFCHVKTGNPKGVLDLEEPRKIAQAIQELQLKYVVLTSVDRDDLPDGGASHFSRTVHEIKKINSEITVEALIPDFNADPKSLDTMLESGAEVLAQNMETVKRLTKKVRDHKSGYEKTLHVLEYFKTKKSSIVTKSSLMVGLGETEAEIFETMDDLRSIGVDILTLGQYLQPSKKQLPVECYVHPSYFEKLKDVGMKKGFRYVAAGPLVRSSYRAGEFFKWK
ncbi:MAG: lipoyl synthase [Deltaproteobacteria bacterium GWA2_38_16]|nr:MAG: lipoyl synthase [Deltaproteobacteria bacterium GWA2_38_16]OGQ02452.1 MAG: lipoyl synthase [Deltaproteobacteria bacterium RIFCSPHIGHO2_02_FULL_38_15]OGQ34870.1 MAG: lipoyl synthase [Deltaproteobacteria bacterium RIFCSPLOWO2_01_FULL_38_9]OGQ59999.1 MAG: lipoyl synthase [Deltaproteobacteria bacterium RIFCSPLOWO2_12_FULL_38_8]HBQ21095.1 lipoyl synthase [Deltaproteobacteria bacterium]